MSSAIPWDLLEQQYESDKRYASLKQELFDSNKSKLNKHCNIESFLFNPEIKFESLQNYNATTHQQPANLQASYWSWLSNPFTTSSSSSSLDQKPPECYRNSLELMQLFMDEVSHLLNYEMPYDASLVSVLTASNDAYVLRDGANDYKQVWPGVDVKYLDRGHVSAYLFDQSVYR